MNSLLLATFRLKNEPKTKKGMWRVEGGRVLLNELKAASKPSSDYKRQAFSEISQKSGSLYRFMGVHTPLVFILEVCIYMSKD